MAAMSDFSISSTAVDLSRLPAPDVIEQLSFEEIYSQNLAGFQALYPGFDATVESDPAVKLLEQFSYRELILRQRFNDRAHQTMLAFAAGGNLDHLGALVGVARLVISADDAATGGPPIYEDDDSLRQRILLAPESFSVAGPELAYVYHAKSADPRVLDASSTSPAPGEIVVAVLSRIGDGFAPADLVAAVAGVVGARDVRPQGDAVTVRSALIVPFAVSATIYTFAGPDTAIVLAAARAGLDRYLADSRKLGRDVTTSSLLAALTPAGVQRVVLNSPNADVVCNLLQAANCTGIALVHGGYAS